MLQTSGGTNSSLRQDTSPELRLPIVSLVDVANFIRRRIAVILLSCFATCGIAVLYLVAATPKFTAQAELVIESKAPLGDAASVSTIVESQVGIIRSESIARAVMWKLDLAKNPEFLGQIGIRASIARLLGWHTPETETTAMRHALESFQRKLSVKRVGLTYIVAVSFESVDPDRAALILNTVVETYVAYQMDAKYNSTIRDETWVKNRLSELGNQASAAQKALEDYKSRTDIPSSSDAVDGAAAPSRSTPQMQSELRELVVAAESAATAFDNFRHVLRHMEAARQQFVPGFEARMVTEALPPLRASSPKGAILLGIAGVAGILLGIAISILRDLSDQAIHTTCQVLKELQIACIAVVPRVKPVGIWRKVGPAETMPVKLGSLEVPIASMRNGSISIAMPSSDGKRIADRFVSTPASTDRPRSRSIVRTRNPIWTIADAPQSRFAESILEIKLAIDTVNRRGKRNQVIGITSTQSNEGTSTIAGALALSMALAGARVILVDCNLRNRSLSAALAPTAASGILDVMTGAVSTSEAMWTDSKSELAFLPVGSNSRSIQASAVLTSEKLQKVFQSLRDTYAYVIVDLPPVVPFADVRATAHLLDAFILVIEPRRTNIGVVERALKVCTDMDEIMLGATLNKADI